MANENKLNDYDVIQERYLAITNELLAEGNDPQMVFIGAYLAGKKGSIDYSFGVHQGFALAVKDSAVDHWDWLENKLIESMADARNA